MSARAASASLSLGFLLKWPGLQQCLQADASTVYAHKRHSGNTAQVRGSAAEFPSLPCTAQGPTLDSVLGLGQQARGGQGDGGRARRSLWAPRGYGIGGQLIIFLSQDPMAFCHEHCRLKKDAQLESGWVVLFGAKWGLQPRRQHFR